MIVSFLRHYVSTLCRLLCTWKSVFKLLDSAVHIKEKPQAFMEKLSRKHHLKWFLDFLPTSLKRLVAKADQKVNQGCENSLVKIYRNVQVITHAAMIIAFNFILFTFLWPTSNSVFLVKSSIEDILRLFYVYPWPTWKISNVTWDKQNLMWHCQFCHNFVAAAALKELMIKVKLNCSGMTGNKRDKTFEKILRSR